METWKYPQDITINIPPIQGKNYIITLDNTSTGNGLENLSKKYIKVAEMEQGNKLYLRITEYVGVESTSMPVGYMVEGEKAAGGRYKFKFTDIIYNGGNTRAVTSEKNIGVWYNADTPNEWVKEVEFVPDTETLSTVTYSCAVVYLVLDRTSSLAASDFSQLKSSAVSVINILAQKAKNEPEPLNASGDVDGDDQVTLADANAIIDLILEEKAHKNQNEADVDGNGRISINDAVTLVKKHQLNK